MNQYRISYMVDPGDGIISKFLWEHESDEMEVALKAWVDAQEHPRFVMKCEIMPEDL
jgi:hypothetical protein